MILSKSIINIINTFFVKQSWETLLLRGTSALPLLNLYKQLKSGRKKMKRQDIDRFMHIYFDCPFSINQAYQ